MDCLLHNNQRDGVNVIFVVFLFFRVSCDVIHGRKNVTRMMWGFYVFFFIKKSECRLNADYMTSAHCFIISLQQSKVFRATFVIILQKGIFSMDV